MRNFLRWCIVALTFGHGLVHLVGAAKGLGWADVTRLHEPIGTTLGAAWLIAAVLVVVAAVLLAARVGWWWLAGVLAVAVSQTVILTSWGDAKAGTFVNMVLLVGVGYGFAYQGPHSYHSQFRRRLHDVAAEPLDADLIEDEDLDRLPDVVARYVRQSGAIGQPRVQYFVAKVHGRISASAGKKWMPFTAEQINTYGREPSRMFLMDATMFGLPVDVFHVFAGGSAAMHVKACSLFPMVNASGPDLDRAETVTLFNDLCVMAPAVLAYAPIRWESIDSHRVRGTFTRGAERVTAELVFDDDDELIDFVSEDRLRASADGKVFVRQRWSTPVTGYQRFGARRIGTIGEARWHAPEPEGEFAYLEFHIDQITYNGTDADVSPETAVGNDLEEPWRRRPSRSPSE